MKKSKCSFWVKQLRRPICAFVVIAIVFFYCIPSFAAELTFSDFISFSEFTGMNSDGNYPLMTDQNSSYYL